MLASAAGRDGNLLLNVGPDRNGQIDGPQAVRLREIGAWLHQYGESIYATRGGPFLPGDWGVSTRRDNTIYLHVLNWPGNKLVLPAIPAKVISVSVLTGGKSEFSQSAKGLSIFLSKTGCADTDTVIKLVLDSPAEKIPLIK